MNDTCTAHRSRVPRRSFGRVKWGVTTVEDERGPGLGFSLCFVCGSRPWGAAAFHLCLFIWLNVFWMFAGSRLLLPESIMCVTYTLFTVQTKTVQSSSRQICRWILMWDDNRGWTFSLEEAFNYGYFGQKWQFKVKTNLMIDLFLTNMLLFISQDVNWWIRLWITCGLLWCFYLLFGLSFWRHPFTAEDPLCNCCNAKFLQICSETNLYTSWMAWGSVNVHNFFCLFDWTILLNKIWRLHAINNSIPVNLLWAREAD